MGKRLKFIVVLLLFGVLQGGNYAFAGGLCSGGRDTLKSGRDTLKRERYSKAAYDREVQKIMFIPKGIISVGTAFSYRETSADDYEFLVVDDILGSMYSFKVSPHVGYFIKDDLSVGARFTYNRSMFKLYNTSLSLTEDLNFSIENFYTVRHSYLGSVYMRNYIGLDRTRRFALFSEVRLSVGGGQGKVMQGSGDDITGTYQNVFQVELGVMPGLCAFVTNAVAVEASVNVLGLSYKKVTQIENQVYESGLETSGANCKVDIFSINIGMSFYF